MMYPSLPQSFFVGECFDAYRILGAHPAQGPHGEKGWRFNVWAPGATAVEICGGFDGRGPGVPMEKANTGLWSGFIAGLAEGDLYKYRVHGADGSVVLHSDPYAFSTELRPGTASRLARLDFRFDDSAWMERRDKCRNLPLNIYELHAGSWKQKPNATKPDGSDGWYDYEELARELIPWLLDHHFTHVELLPLAEHPFDGSWGYQTTGYFAVTSRYGSPGPVRRRSSTPATGWASASSWTSSPSTLPPTPTRWPTSTAPISTSTTAMWATASGAPAISTTTAGEVRSFLSSAAALWMEVYHCDGIRMDAISRALYWQGDPARGVNEGAVTFLRNLNHGLNERWPTGIYMAEDSTNFLKVTAPTRYDGIGFDYKWDMGWMHDTLDYFATPFGERPNAYGQDHRSVCTISTMSCTCWPSATTKSSTARRPSLISSGAPTRKSAPSCAPCTFYMYTHPGKKLNFMGNEMAHFREWDEKRPLDWDLLKYPFHDSLPEILRRRLPPVCHRARPLRRGVQPGLL